MLSRYKRDIREDIYSYGFIAVESERKSIEILLLNSESQISKKI